MDLGKLSRLEDAYNPQRKMWIATAIGAGVGLASSLIGGAQARRARKRAEARQREREAEENAWYRRRYNEDYLDTAAGQNLLRRANDYARENWRKASGAKAVAGGTDAATAMAKEAGNKMVGDTIANIAAGDQQRKAQIDTIHQGNREKYAQMDINRHERNASDITEASQNASNAIMGLGSVFEKDMTNIKPNINPKLNFGASGGDDTISFSTPTLGNVTGSAEQLKKEIGGLQ